ncbi:von Willebrand factor A domain-containing protein 8-like isoform X2 [Xenia sp. Carnegie-2017]|nr:von Willebrand factor A domain-containing protein 8-like isoform X2 [Xenia sp. Carnegie-2017]
MQLDDGRFLVSAERYDSLLKHHSREELDNWKLLRVSENFRVFALGVPVPRYPGNPLDPPLRSRFQCRNIPMISYKELMKNLRSLQKVDFPKKRLSNLANFVYTLHSSELLPLGMPDFPIENMDCLIEIMNHLPHVSCENLVKLLYPYQLIFGEEGQNIINDVIQRFHMNDPSSVKPYCLKNVICSKDQKALVTLESENVEVVFDVPSGNIEGIATQLVKENNFVMTSYHSKLLSEMLQTHLVKDFCLIGPKGCGKSALIHQFAKVLGYQMEPIHLHEDMTSRDLLQQRMMSTNGDSIWQPSPLIIAAIKGHLAVLDGIHRINPGTLSVLQRLLIDREISLYDGTHLLRKDRYEILKEKSGLSDEQLSIKQLYPIHPSFRVIGVAEHPMIKSGEGQWLNSELLPLFLYHHVEAFDCRKEADIVYNMVPEVPKNKMQVVLKMVDKLRNSDNSLLSSITPSFSTRQLLRIAKRLARYPNEDLYEIITASCLAEFLPSLAKSALEDVMQEMDIFKTTVNGDGNTIKILDKDGYIHIDEVQHKIYDSHNKTKVPDTTFYWNHQHLQVLKNMLKDFSIGEHLLLVGNQGVGKNKLVDKFLQLLNKPREYVQLHRDTTVQTLTLQPTVDNGVIVYEDSPLVQALQLGHVLVIDEADKAPVNVTCILKTLVENGEMFLGDGRRVVPSGSKKIGDNIIVTHPDFRVIVLANRPGFPFLGNDFFGSMGDVFSCHAINNPEKESEMEMLKQYGPNVPQHILTMLVDAFAELRCLVDVGQIAYPYSTREVVNVVKHLQVYPEDGLGEVLRNVFDFDSYHTDVQKTVVSILRKHGIPYAVNSQDIKLSKKFPLPKPNVFYKWSLGDDETRICSVKESALVFKKPVDIKCSHFGVERLNARSTGFTELLNEWIFPLYESSVVFDLSAAQGVNVVDGNWLHVVTANPLVIYSMQTNKDFVICTNLYPFFPNNYFNHSPHVKIAALNADGYYGQIIVHEQLSNVMLLLNPCRHEMQEIVINDYLSTSRISRSFTKSKHIMHYDKAFPNWLITWRDGENDIRILNFSTAKVFHVSLSFPLEQVRFLSEEKWILKQKESRSYYLYSFSEKSVVPNILSKIHQNSENRLLQTIFISKLSQESYSKCEKYLPDVLQSDGTLNAVHLVADDDHLAGLAVTTGSKVYQSQPNILRFYFYPRENKIDRAQKPRWKEFYPDPLCLSGSCQVVRVVPSSLVPTDDYKEKNEKVNFSNYLEVVDISENSVCYLPLPYVKQKNLYTQKNTSTALICSLSNDILVSVSLDGLVRLWETGANDLKKSFSQWKSLVGSNIYSDDVQVTHEKNSGLDVSQPKHGKIDFDNAPHVGGNTWAGGTGGRDTAGLGGKGGPYRLDSGHDVYQISDKEKDSVPDEVKIAAREMGRKTFKQRLKDIEMNEYEAEKYEMFSSRVKHQVQSLRVLVESLQSKRKERQWIRHQTLGDLDDSKLIEGLTGEKTIYKKRINQHPEPGSVQDLPKQMRLVVDVSGSMYRFNGLDGRLERMMEAACLVMESFDQYQQRFKFDIVGHSGENPEIMFVSQDKPVVNNKQRLQVLETMYAHAQFCMTGDNTLEASKRAINEVFQRKADDYYVIIFSDANLQRYGISPTELTKTLFSNTKVNTFIIFIGSLGNEAERLSKKLPHGRSFVCMDTKDIPEILQHIFSTVISSS